MMPGIFSMITLCLVLLILERSHMVMYHTVAMATISSPITSVYTSLIHFITMRGV